MKEGTAVAAHQVSDGRRIRWTLEQLAQSPTDRVRIDWLRFTVPLDALIPADDRGAVDATQLGALDWRGRELSLAARLSTGTDEPVGAMYVARKAANMLRARLPGFEVGAVEDKGMDFYLARVPVLFEGVTVGHVLAGGSSSTQAATVHFNLHGAACLRITSQDHCRIAAWIRQSSGWITRCDLAVDVFDGDDITDMPRAYLSGAFDLRGQRPKQREAGSWTSGFSRTFYVGRRETGKELRAYEKGDELFGPELDDAWIRYEVEFRNNLRVIDVAILERPADFFAGAYQFCADLLDRIGVDSHAQRIPAGQRVKDATAKAAAHRVAAWIKRVAAPSVCALLQYGGDLLENIVDSEAHRTAVRLRGWNTAELAAAFRSEFGALAPAPSP